LTICDFIECFTTVGCIHEGTIICDIAAFIQIPATFGGGITVRQATVEDIKMLLFIGGIIAREALGALVTISVAIARFKTFRGCSPTLDQVVLVSEWFHQHSQRQKEYTRH
jgi:hypothetical protein